MEVLPGERSDEEMQGAMPADRTDDQMVQELPPERTDEEMSRAEHYSAPQAPEVARGFNTPRVTAAQTQESFSAGNELYNSEEHGWLSKVLHHLTLPEQFIARHVVNGLENLGAMSSDEAKDLLSRREVNGSDITNFYFKSKDGGFGEGAARFTVGLAADILLDPLSYLGIGALTKSGKVAKVAGSAISLEKVSKAQRRFFKGLEAVETIIKEDGRVVSATSQMPAEQIVKDNMQKLAQLRDGELGFDDFSRTVNASPSAKEQLLKSNATLFKQQSWADEWAQGERGLTLGFRIPFTRIAAETDILPRSLSKAVGKQLQAFGSIFDIGEEALSLLPGGQVASAFMGKVWSSIKTKTGWLQFDDAMNKYLGRGDLTKHRLSVWETGWRDIMSEKKESMAPGEFDQYIKDITNELEWGVPDKAEFLAERGKASYSQQFDFQDFGGRVDESKEFKFIKDRPEDLARAQRLSQHPETAALVAQMRDQNMKMVMAYRERGVPFERLNPFGPGWVRDYVKHMVSNEWFDRMDQLGDAAAHLDDALGYIETKIGKVDTSSLGRQYRGSIEEANKISMDKYGAKIFVDDPIELHVRRMREMDNIVRNYDLMDAAKVHAYRGKRPPAGYVKFETTDFKPLVLDESTKDFDKWRQFIPDFYKQSDVHIPEEIYDRFKLQLLDRGSVLPAARIFEAFNAFNKIWRNNALFGPGYLGMNALSNTTTLFAFGGLTDPAMSLAETAKVLTPWFKDAPAKIAMRDALGKSMDMTAEELFELALEHNVLKSSFNTFNMNFGDFAEHVASNRQAPKKVQIPRIVKSIAEKIPGSGSVETYGDLADLAFLWRHNRGAAQLSDSIPRMAVFIDRLKSGYTAEAAAEAVEKYFYNYNVMGKGQRIVADLLPFSTFPMKTTEMVVDMVKQGELARLTIPGKVQAALSGAFIMDEDTRAALNEVVPPYPLAMDKVHGFLIPGGREVLLEAPWAVNALNFITNPQENLHPFVQLAMWAAGRELDAGEQVESLEGVERRTEFSKALDYLLPAVVREPLALMELNGVWDFGGVFSKKYSEAIPTPQQLTLNAKGEQNEVGRKFDNALQFGSYVDEQLRNQGGIDGLMYKMIFPEQFDYSTLKSDAYASEKLIQRGNYVRSKFRQFALGAASMTKFDQNFFINKIAIDRQINALDKKIFQETTEAGGLAVHLKMKDADYLQKLAETRPEAVELQALMNKRDALSDYYDFFLGMTEKHPEFDIPNLIFGTKDIDFDFSLKPKNRDWLDYEGQVDKLNKEMKDFEYMHLLDQSSDRLKPPAAPTENENPSDQEEQ